MRRKSAMRVYAGDAGGIRCYEKFGFQREGTLRESVFREGAYRDMVLMSILASEFVPSG